MPAGTRSRAAKGPSTTVNRQTNVTDYFKTVRSRPSSPPNKLRKTTALGRAQEIKSESETIDLTQKKTSEQLGTLLVCFLSDHGNNDGFRINKTA